MDRKVIPRVTDDPDELGGLPEFGGFGGDTLGGGVFGGHDGDGGREGGVLVVAAVFVGKDPGDR